MTTNTAKTVTLIKAKETKNKVVFEEQPAENEAPIIGSLYVSKWWAGTATSLSVTVTKVA